MIFFYIVVQILCIAELYVYYQSCENSIKAIYLKQRSTHWSLKLFPNPFKYCIDYIQFVIILFIYIAFFMYKL